MTASRAARSPVHRVSGAQVPDELLDFGGRRLADRHGRLSLSSGGASEYPGDSDVTMYRPIIGPAMSDCVIGSPVG